MVYFINADGAVVQCIPAGIHCGSAEANRVVLVAPFSHSAAVSAAFLLPSGEETRPYLLQYEGRLNGYAALGGAGAAGELAYVWSLALPACVSAVGGRVQVQFYFYGGNGEKLASAAASFLVEDGISAQPPEETNAYDEVLAALAQLTGGMAGGTHAARSLCAWREGVAYGQNELVYCPAAEGRGVTFVRSLQAENTAAPYGEDGALDAAHWEEAFSFEGVLDAFEEKLFAFTDTALAFVEQLPAVGEEGKLYATLTAEDPSLFTLYIYRSGAWVELGSKSVTLLPTENAVRYTAQQLTSEQQAQARANIGAASASGAGTVTAAQLEAGLASLAAVADGDEALPSGLREGAGIYTYVAAVPETSAGRLADYNFSGAWFSTSGWTLIGGEGVSPAPSFEEDGLHIAEGLVADRGAAAIANPLKGKAILHTGMSVVLHVTASGALCNDYDSLFGFCAAADSADAGYEFFSVMSSGSGVRFNANGEGNLGETYYDITGKTPIDLTAPSLYVLTMTHSEICIYCNGTRVARYGFTSEGNTVYRVDTLSAISEMDYFVLGCCTAQLGWGNPAMRVLRAAVCNRALTAEEVLALSAQSGYQHSVRVGGGQAQVCVKNAQEAGAAAEALHAQAADRLALSAAVGETGVPVYFNADGEPVACGIINVSDSGYGPIAIGANAVAADFSGVALGLQSSASGGLSVAIGRNAGVDASGGSAVALGSGASADHEYSVAIGATAVTTAADQIQLGGSDNSYVYYYGTLSQRSDERDKADLQDFDDEKSLQFVTSLRTFSYVRNPRGSYEYPEEEQPGARALRRKYGLGPYDKAAHAAGGKKGSRRRAGVSAQDICACMEEGFGNTDCANLVCDSLYDRRQAGEEIPAGVESQLEVSYVSLIPFLISAMRAQQQRIRALEERLLPQEPSADSGDAADESGAAAE